MHENGSQKEESKTRGIELTNFSITVAINSQCSSHDITGQEHSRFIAASALEELKVREGEPEEEEPRTRHHKPQCALNSALGHAAQRIIGSNKT